MSTEQHPSKALGIARAIANNMHRAAGSEGKAPEPEAYDEYSAEFVIETPLGRFRVGVREIG